MSQLSHVQKINGLVSFLERKGCLDLSSNLVTGPLGSDEMDSESDVESIRENREARFLDVKSLTNDIADDDFCQPLTQESGVGDFDGPVSIPAGSYVYGPAGVVVTPGHPREAGWNNPPINRSAWYQPIHFFGPDMGIFIVEEALIRLTADVAGVLLWAGHQNKGLLWHRARRFAFGFLYLHESFHHRVESFGFRAHVMSGVGCYRGYKKLVYRANYGTDTCLEEAMANAYAYIELKRQPKWLKGLTAQQKKAVLEYLESVMNRSPPGYRCWEKHVHDFKFGSEYHLRSQIKEMTDSPCGLVLDWIAGPDLMRPILNIDQQVLALVPQSGWSTLPCHRDSAPPVKVRQLTSYLSALGFTRDKKRGKGSHQYFVHPGPPEKRHVVPVHGQASEISIGVLRQIAIVHGETVRSFSEQVRTS